MANEREFQSILITGAEGMLGSDLSLVARAQGYTVFEAGLAGCPVELDITSAESIRIALDNCQPDIVINCAAYTAVDLAESEPDRALQVNCTGAGLLAEACALAGLPICSISTDYVFDGDKVGGYRETDDPNPLGAYAVSKYAGEVAVRLAATDSWIIRTSWLYGIGGKCFPSSILNAAHAGRPLRVVSDQFGCPTYTVDLAEAILRIVKLAPFGVYHAAGQGSTNWFEFAKRILELAGIDYPVERITTMDWPTPARRPANSILLSDAMESVGLPPLRLWNVALADYIRTWKMEQSGRLVK